LIFYIAIAIVVAVFIYNTFLKRYPDAEEGFIAAGFTTVILIFVVGIIALASPKETKQVSWWVQPLVQLDEYRNAGKIFIENDPNEVEYIFKDPRGALVQGEVPAWDSTIREGAKTATVKTTQFDHFNHWVLPWNMGTTYHYEFNVPAKSVYQEVESHYEYDD
jgi:hypothetical protein